MSRSDTAYFELFARLWTAGDSFLLVEHDIEITDRAVRQAKHCACWWAVTPYNGPQGEPLEGSLGFTRFRRQLIEAFPDLPAKAVGNPNGTLERNWRCLDTRILGALRTARYRPHIHRPPVIQHHVYDGSCTCGTDHPELTVDPEGRYLP